MKAVLALLVLAATPSLAAPPPTVVRQIDGYVCMKLNLTERQALDPNGSGVYIQTAPADDAPHVMLAPSVVFVRTPNHVEGGYVEVLQPDTRPNGVQAGWIKSSDLKPMDPNRRCVPTLMSNGMVGAG